MGHSHLDWSFYALHLVFPVILYLLFGSYLHCQLKCLVSAVRGVFSWSVPISRKKKRKCSHRERRARVKARVSKWRRRALVVALVLRCRRRPCNKPPRLVPLVSKVSEPVRWKWKNKSVGLDSVMSTLDPASINSFCAADHDFLRLPHLLKTLCNHDYHVGQIKLALDRVALLCGTFEMHHSGQRSLDPKTLMLIWDTGASAGLTPFWSDFIDYVECEIDVCDISKVKKVIGIGTTLHKFVDNNGNNVYLPCVSYHLPSTDVRLFSPQIYHQLHGGHSVVCGDAVEMVFGKYGGSTVTIPIDKDGTNLPVIRDSFVSQKIKQQHASKFRSALNATGLYAALDYFANMSTKVGGQLSTSSRLQGLFSSYPCVGGLANENLLQAQRELLLWHWRLGIGMQRIQVMMRNRTFEDPFGRSQVHPPIIKSKFTSTSSCAIPKCQS